MTNGPGGKTFHYADVRYVSTGTLNSINPAWLMAIGAVSHSLACHRRA